MEEGFVYILSNKNRTTTYIGVTNDIERRMVEHKCGFGSKFTSKYNLNDLMCFEHFDYIVDAIDREKQLKNWHRDWKWNLIKQENPNLQDLAANWYTKEEIFDYKVALANELNFNRK